jgi:hypothetical protein
VADKDGAPKKDEADDTITLSKADLQELLTNAMANAAKIAAEAGNAARDHRRDDVDFIGQIINKPVEEREAALIAYLQSLSPQQRESREAAIRDAYASIPSTAEPTADRQPGSLVSVGKDSGGSDVKAKVRTTREWVIANYPNVVLHVERVPRGGVTVKGANFPLVRGINEVPSIVAELYSWWVSTQERLEASYPPLTAVEEDNMKQQLARGAKQVISRVHQVSVGILPPDNFPAQQSQE